MAGDDTSYPHDDIDHPDDTDDHDERAVDRTISRNRESARRKLYLAGEFYAQIAEAAAHGFRAFRSEMESEEVERRGFAHSLVVGMTQGHTTFVREATDATVDLLDPDRD